LKSQQSLDIQPDQQDVDLVGKILDSMGVHLDKPKPVTIEITPTPAAVLPSTDPINSHQIPIEIFSGNLHMADVANFDVTASILSGSFDDILKLIPSSLDCVGRIEPNMVWDYLDKVKKYPGKEICILRFASNDDAGYFNFFTYLHTRQRFGVIKSTSPKIKDFYLVPVEASRPLPKVLLPLTGPGFIEGEEHKPDLLLGVILKILPENKVSSKKVLEAKMLNKKFPQIAGQEATTIT
jgi:SPOC domain